MVFGAPIKPPFDERPPEYGDWYTFRQVDLRHTAEYDEKIPMPPLSRLDSDGRLISGPDAGYFPDPFSGKYDWDDLARYEELNRDPNWELVNIEHNRLISIPENELVVYTVTNSGYVYADDWREYSQEVYGNVGQSDDDAIRSLGLDPDDTGYYYGGRGYEERYSVAETSVPISDIPSNARFIQPSQR